MVVGFAPKVSALVSVYNAGRFIRHCLDDLVGQTLFQAGKMEIVVVDSASPDGEAAEIARFQALYPDAIRSIRTTQREGLYAAWNRAARMARGQYLTSANADDRHRPDALERLALALDRDPAVDLVYSDSLVTYKENETFQRHTRAGIHLRPDWSPAIMGHGCHMGPQPMWRRSVHDRIGDFDESYRSAGDYEFWCRMAASGMKMLHLPEFLGLYQENPAGICNSDPGLGARETDRVKNAYLGKFPSVDRDWSDNRVRPMSDPSFFVHLAIHLTSAAGDVDELFGGILHLTTLPHRITVFQDNVSADVGRKLASLDRQGVIHRLVVLESPSKTWSLATEGWKTEPDAACLVLMDGSLVPSRRAWLQGLVLPVGRLRRTRLELCRRSIVDFSDFPEYRKHDAKRTERIVCLVEPASARGRRREALSDRHSLRDLPPRTIPSTVGHHPYLPCRPGSIETEYVHIVMITYNRLEFTQKAIEGLHATATLPYVLTVVDNGSTDGSREWLESQRRDGRISRLVLLDENVGVAKAANLGWALEPGAKYFVKLDNDMVLTKSGWLEEMVSILDASDDIGMIAANVEPRSFPEFHEYGVRFRVKRGTLGGACVMIPRRVHDRLGFWSEHYGKYGEEDFDYGFRSMLSGYRNVYLSDEETAFHLPAGKAAEIAVESFVALDGQEEKLHRQYRQMKDAIRAENHRTGIVSKRLLEYWSGKADLWCESIFAKENRLAHGWFPPRSLETVGDDPFVLDGLKSKTVEREPLPRANFWQRMLARRM